MAKANNKGGKGKGGKGKGGKDKGGKGKKKQKKESSSSSSEESSCDSDDSCDSSESQNEEKKTRRFRLKDYFELTGKKAIFVTAVNFLLAAFQLGLCALGLVLKWNNDIAIIIGLVLGVLCLVAQIASVVAYIVFIKIKNKLSLVRTIIIMVSSLIILAFLAIYLPLYFATGKTEMNEEGMKGMCNKYGCETTILFTLPALLFVFTHFYECFYRFNLNPGKKAKPFTEKIGYLIAVCSLFCLFYFLVFVFPVLLFKMIRKAIKSYNEKKEREAEEAAENEDVFDGSEVEDSDEKEVNFHKIQAQKKEKGKEKKKEAKKPAKKPSKKPAAKPAKKPAKQEESDDDDDDDDYDEEEEVDDGDYDFEQQQIKYYYQDEEGNFQETDEQYASHYLDENGNYKSLYER